MPYSGDVVKYVVGGACGSDNWSIGVYQQLTGLSSVPTPTQMNAAAAWQLGGFNTIIWGGTNNYLKAVNGSGVTLTTCKAYLYQNGVLTAQGVGSQTSSAGTGTAGQPFYTALCCSLLTAAPGRSGRGRIYLPYTGAAMVVTNGQLASSQQNLVTAVASWLTGMGGNTTLYPGTPTCSIVVLSQKTGLVHNVTTVRADSQPDTQHGRTRKQVASSTWSATV
jgi:hypothetical protein